MSKDKRKLFNPFYSAFKERFEAKKIPETAQTKSDSFKLAFDDAEFLLRDDLRPVRLQLELLKPELILQENNIHSTIVVFGSARIPEPKVAKKNLEEALRSVKLNPDNERLKSEARRAERIVEKSHYYTEAQKFSKIVSCACQQDSNCEYVITTGGGPGIMEAACRGANEINAKSIALNVALPHEQMPNQYSTPELNFQFHYFALRKMHFLLRAKALVVFPGGFGTLDELFEALTLLQTGKINPIPVILFGETFWDKVLDFQFLVDEGMILANDLELFQYVEHADEAWDIIQDFYGE